MDEDSFEDEYDSDTEMDEPFAGDTEPEDRIDEAESHDDFTAKDAFIVGGAFGWGYEEGVEESCRKRLLKEQSKRRKRKKLSDDSE